jgi:hypothetical protein
MPLNPNGSRQDGLFGQNILRVSSICKKYFPLWKTFFYKWVIFFVGMYQKNKIIKKIIFQL